MGGLEQDKVEYEARIARENTEVVNEDLVIIKNDDGTTNMVMMIGHKTKNIEGYDASYLVMHAIIECVIERDVWSEEEMIGELNDWGFRVKVIRVESVQTFKME